MALGSACQYARKAVYEPLEKAAGRLHRSGLEQNVLTVQAERRTSRHGRRRDGRGLTAARVFRWQLFLGETLSLDKVEASYDAGVLTVRIPEAEEARPRKIEIGRGDETKEIAG
ncbi:Hsp20/alpha crystallin family protein [Streptomyces jeddahensis]|uniref:Hsp20/alpha crystallin family protein n=1 Tax=Streptomyces jeddahensis TaxID=1716141 RepID=UPI00098F7A7A|nr:Hsp20/alpha crystallin family protein [Streptomyces jeddahensis]